MRKMIYLDASNLHDYALPKFLRKDGFKWIEPKEFNIYVNSKKLSVNSRKE